MTTMATTNAAGVFQLYQEGLGPDQVLQLCFTRRRSPRRLQTEHTRAEDAFVLPRPALEIGSVMPLVEVSLQQLVEESLLATSTHSSLKATTDATVTQAKESVKKHFLLPREAEDEELEQWSALQEADWLSVWHSLQSRQDQDDEMTGEALVDPVALPDIADVCWILKQCPSDSFVRFVWNHLLVPLLKRCVRPSDLKGRDPAAPSDIKVPEPSILCSTPPYETLLTLLVAHRSFASLSPKDLRAKVRARKLRQVDDVFGAQVELLLVSLYHQHRGGLTC